MVNGILFRPIGDAKLTVDPAKRRIDSGRGVYELSVGGRVIFRGAINMIVGALRSGRAAVDPLKAPAGATIGAMPIAGNVEIVFDAALRALDPGTGEDAVHRVAAAHVRLHPAPA